MQSSQSQSWKMPFTFKFKNPCWCFYRWIFNYHKHKRNFTWNYYWLRTQFWKKTCLFPFSKARKKLLLLENKKRNILMLKLPQIFFSQLGNKIFWSLVTLESVYWYPYVCCSICTFTCSHLCINFFLSIYIYDIQFTKNNKIHNF